MASTRWQKIGGAVSKTMVTLLTIVALLLTFFLLQSKFSGSEPAVLGHKIYIVMSGSMEPAIKTGSLIAVKILPAEEIQPGDVITYRSDRSANLTTHRVHHLELDDGLLFHTKGDANNALDPLPVEGRQLVGKVTFMVPRVGYLFAYTRTSRGQLILFGLAALTVALELARNIWGPRRKQRPYHCGEVGEDTNPIGPKA